MSGPPEEERRTKRSGWPVPPQPGVTGREPAPADEPLPPPPPVPLTFHPAPGGATGPTLTGPAGSGGHGTPAAATAHGGSAAKAHPQADPQAGSAPGPGQATVSGRAGSRPAEAAAPVAPAEAAAPAPSTSRPVPATASEAELAGQTLTGPAASQAATAAAVATAPANPFGAGPSTGGPVALPDLDRQDPSRQPLFTATRVPSGRMPRLQVGWHTVATAVLSALTVSAQPAGLVLGADRSRDPVTVRLFAPQPTRVALVGGAWPAYLVVVRALALGARVTVVTSDPAGWAEFGRWAASGPGDQVTVLAGEQPVELVGTPQRPALVVYDLGVTGARTPADLGPWQSQLTVLRRLDRPGLGVVQESSLTLLQRLDPTEALIAGSALRLPPHSGRFLQVMADDMLAVVADGGDRYIWVTPTQTELRYAGPPRR